jgi:hypothetical protein
MRNGPGPSENCQALFFATFPCDCDLRLSNVLYKTVGGSMWCGAEITGGRAFRSPIALRAQEKAGVAVQDEDVIPVGFGVHDSRSLPRDALDIASVYYEP